MGLFDFIGNVVGGVVHTVLTPVDVVRDAVSLGGELDGEHETYTSKRIRKIGECASDAVDEITG